MNKTFEDHCWKDVMDEEMREVYSSYNREPTSGEILPCSPSIFTTSFSKAARRPCRRL